MDTIGAEVGQKMRSAIKAKLMELECYVDDELPDYIMVMVANRRSKSQMNEDLNLFLSSKTSTFVNWLHIVLKKLKEVTVTNPEIYTKASKRKASESHHDEKPNVKVKKEKNHKKVKKELDSQLSHDNSDIKSESPLQKSLTDDLPLMSHRFTEKRRVVISDENNIEAPNNIVEDNFDIPLLSDVSETSNDKELHNIEKKGQNVKSRLGSLVESDCEENWKSSEEKEDNNLANSRKISILNSEVINSLGDVNKDKPIDKELAVQKKSQHKRITFDKEESTDNTISNKSNSGRKPSILDRLGKRANSPEIVTEPRKRISLAEYRREEEKYIGSRVQEKSKQHTKRERSRSPHKTKKEGILGRLGVHSKVAVIKKPEVIEESEDEEELIVREVPSLIKVKPRVIPSDVPQPNKNLLLKAVAEAQRSIAQTPKVGNNIKPDALFTKRYKEKLAEGREHKELTTGKIDEKEKTKLRALIQQSTSRSRTRGRTQTSSDEYDSEGEYIPKPVKNVERDVPKYVPSLKHGDDGENATNEQKDSLRQQFIITLDGIEKTRLGDKKLPAKLRLEGRKAPSPIVFDKLSNDKVTPTRTDIPDKLPIVQPPLAIKNKERCKYWPNCRHGDKCEFIHPTQNCEAFPNCKFGAMCLFLHPRCKFGNSCTKRDCPYDHTKSASSVTTSPVLQNCKFFPNCTNPGCTFYHPKPCKYGKYCKNMPDCTFAHNFVPNKKNLSWRSN